MINEPVFSPFPLTIHHDSGSAWEQMHLVCSFIYLFPPSEQLIYEIIDLKAVKSHRCLDANTVKCCRAQN